MSIPAPALLARERFSILASAADDLPCYAGPLRLP